MLAKPANRKSYQFIIASGFKKTTPPSTSRKINGGKNIAGEMGSCAVTALTNYSFKAIKKSHSFFKPISAQDQDSTRRRLVCIISRIIFMGFFLKFNWLFFFPKESKETIFFLFFGFWCHLAALHRSKKIEEQDLYGLPKEYYDDVCLCFR